MKEWSFDRSAYPDVQMSDIIFYLEYKKSFFLYKQRYQSVPSLESYNHFVCGWIRDVVTKEINGNITVSAKVVDFTLPYKA